MRLKIFTTAFLFFGVILLLAWPWVLGEGPPQGPEHQQELKAYAGRVLAYMTTILLSFLATLICAYVLIKRQQAEFRRLAQENLQGLLEATLKDHEQRKP
jgi:hypothetical protein